jgi:HSP20 family protein
MVTTLTKRSTPPARSWFNFGPLENLREEMQDLMTRTFGEDTTPWPYGRINPALDVSETDAAVEVRMDIPGAEAKELDIQVSGNVLTIRGERKEEKEEKRKTYHRIERRVGSFSRSITLPTTVKEEGIDAKYQDGVLTVVLPKTEEARPKKVQVRT